MNRDLIQFGKVIAWFSCAFFSFHASLISLSLRGMRADASDVYVYNLVKVVPHFTVFSLIGWLVALAGFFVFVGPINRERSRAAFLFSVLLVTVIGVAIKIPEFFGRYLGPQDTGFAGLVGAFSIYALVKGVDLLSEDMLSESHPSD